VKASRHRLAEIADRLELLAGYIIAYLDLDEVIRIIRTEDEPKPVLMQTFSLNERQAEAILNMRLRSLRKLEEMELRREQEKLAAEQADLDALVNSPARQKTMLKKQLAALGKEFSAETPAGKRRSTFADAPQAVAISRESMIEREPVTIIVSQRNWVRAQKGHADLAQLDGLKFKEGDGLQRAFHAETTDRILLAASGGRFFTLLANDLPGGRGFGEPLSLMVDWPQGEDIVAALPFKPGLKLLLAASDGKGFVADAKELLAETRKGRQVMNLRDGARVAVIRPIGEDHDHVAVIGENRKLLVFLLDALPEMTRGQGAALQKYRDGGLSDAITLKLSEGLSWKLQGESARTRTEADMTPWRGARASAGRLPPQGFPKDNRFQ
jgi:topoisomerase-4 subunit A